MIMTFAGSGCGCGRDETGVSGYDSSVTAASGSTHTNKPERNWVHATPVATLSYNLPPTTPYPPPNR